MERYSHWDDLVMRPGTPYRPIGRLLDAGLAGELTVIEAHEQSHPRSVHDCLVLAGAELGRLVVPVFAVVVVFDRNRTVLTRLVDQLHARC